MRFNKRSGATGISLRNGLPLSETPDKPIRGHQLGYRNTANSYDGWTAEQFEQYIRDLVVFGTNSIESIPIFDEKPSPHFKLPAAEMNRRISEICEQYDIDYWMWVPAQFDLKDKAETEKISRYLRKYLQVFSAYQRCFFSRRRSGEQSAGTGMALIKGYFSNPEKISPAGCHLAFPAGIYACAITHHL